MNRRSTPILCRACSKNNGDSYVGYRSRSGKSAWGTWSTGRAFRRCAAVYVQSDDACAWTLLDTPRICTAFALKYLPIVLFAFAWWQYGREYSRNKKRFYTVLKLLDFLNIKHKRKNKNDVIILIILFSKIIHNKILFPSTNFFIFLLLYILN